MRTGATNPRSYLITIKRVGTVYSEGGPDKRRTTGFEILNDVFYKDLSLGLGVMLTDVNYANAEDVYLSAAYIYPQLQNFNLNTSVGASLYNASRDDQLIQTTESFSFNEARIGLSKTVAKRIDLSLDYVYGGKGRDDIDFDNYIVVSANFNFQILLKQ